MMKMKVLGGLVAGAIVGSAITMIMDPMSGRQKRKLRRTGNRVVKTVGSMLDSFAMRR